MPTRFIGDTTWIVPCLRRWRCSPLVVDHISTQTLDRIGSGSLLRSQKEDQKMKHKLFRLQRKPGSKWLFHASDERKWKMGELGLGIHAQSRCTEGKSKSAQEEIEKRAKKHNNPRRRRNRSGIGEYQYHATSWDRLPSILKKGLQLPRSSDDVSTFMHDKPSISTANSPDDALPYHPQGALLKLRVKRGAKYWKRSLVRHRKKIR